MSARSSSVRLMGADGEVKEFSVYPFPRAGLKSVKGIASFDGMLLIRSPKDKLYVHGRFAQKFGFCHIGWTWGWLPRMADMASTDRTRASRARSVAIFKHS